MRLNKSLVLAGLICSLCVARLSAAVVAPSDLLPGNQYQLIFITADGDHPDGLNDPQKLSETYYNSFVTTEAGLSAGLPSATWSVVGSADVAANVNAPAPLPVYNTAGQLVAHAGTLYSGSLTASVLYDQYGNLAPQDVWTGSDSSGNISANPLGGTAFLTLVAFGLSNHSDALWLNVPGGGDPAGAQSFSYYALSSAITAVPEPASLILSVFGLVSLTTVHYMRRRQSSF